MSQYGPDLTVQGHVWSRNDCFYFYFFKGVPFLPSFCFVCVAGGLCVCVVEYLCVVDSLSVWATVDVCVQKVLSTRAKRRLPHTPGCSPGPPVLNVYIDKLFVSAPGTPQTHVFFNWPPNLGLKNYFSSLRPTLRKKI